jgi:hypothetical protein
MAISVATLIVFVPGFALLSGRARRSEIASHGFLRDCRIA